MEFQRARSGDQIEKRQKEIIDACDSLFSTGDYEAITLQAISAMTSIARSSIYTYYHTKEEILIDVLKREQLKWNEDLVNYFSNYTIMTKEQYAKALTVTLLKREKFLKLSSIHFTAIEKNCSLEKLTEFSIEVQPCFDTLNSTLEKYFSTSTEKTRSEFTFHLHSFINGIYPYLHPTPNQVQALYVANPNYVVPDFEEICYKGIFLLLGNL